MIFTIKKIYTSTDKDGGRLISPSAALGVLLFFVFSFLTTHEVSVEDSTQLSAILTLDLITGALIWVLLSNKAQYTFFELAGVGIAIGTSFNTIGQLIFRNSFFGETFNYWLFVFALATLSIKNCKKSKPVLIESIEQKSLLITFAATLVLLCGDRYHLWIAVITLLFGAYIKSYFEKLSKTLRYKYISYTTTYINLIIAFFLTSFIENEIFGPRTIESYIGSWDAVYVEASSKSLLIYGPLDNIFLANTKNAYYWFSFAWSGALSQRSSTSDWIVSTQFGFLLVAIATMSIVASILQSPISRSANRHLVLVIIASTSLIGSTSFLIDTGSFSQCFAVLLLALVIFLAKELIDQASISTVFLLTLTIGLLVLTKLTIAIPVLFAFCIHTIIIWTQRTTAVVKFFHTVFLIISGGLSILLYLLFIRQEFPTGQSNFQIGLTRNAFEISSGLLIIDVLLLLLFKLPALVVVKKSEPTLIFMSLLLCISASSLIMSITIVSSWVNSANTYLLIPFNFSANLAISFGILLMLDNGFSKEIYRSSLFHMATLLCILSGVVGTSGLYFLFLNFAISSTRVMLLIYLPLILVPLISSLIICNRNKLHSKNIRFALFCFLLLTSSTGFFIAHTFREVERKLIFSINNWDVPSEQIQPKMLKVLGAVEYIKLNVVKSDIIADNFDASVLLPALTGVRSFASSYGRDFSSGHNERYSIQRQFYEQPTTSNLRYLRSNCVTWYFVYKGGDSKALQSFEPYATTMYEDEYGAVLKLSESYPLPDECFK